MSVTRMGTDKRLLRVVGVVASALVASLLCTSAILASEQDEPFLKFLNDFEARVESVPERDPYEERIETDRHDFTQSPTTVGRGVLQIEGGYTFNYKDDAETETSHTFPEMLFRIGLTEDIEFRIRSNYAWKFVDDEDNKDGAEDLRLGFKLGITEQTGLIPESALEIGMSVPTGASVWSTDEADFGLDYIYGWEITECLKIYGSTGFFQNALGDFGFAVDDPGSDQFIVTTQSAAVGVDVTECTTLYAEFYGKFSSNREDNLTVGVFNIGIDYYLTNNLVLDIRSGVGLTDDSDDFFVGVGGGYRF